MQRYILTGAPGAGKTVLLRRLELAGYGVIEEAATDLIALVTAQGVERHWEAPNFIDDIVALPTDRPGVTVQAPFPLAALQASCTSEISLNGVDITSQLQGGQIFIISGKGRT